MQQRSAAEISRAELAAQESGAVVVEIYDQVYQLRGTDPQYIDRLAGMVDDKMRAVSAHGATVDSLRVAVLAALNIADELVRMKARYEAVSNQLAAQQAQLATQQAQVAQQAQNAFRSRAGSLAGMLDDVLMERKAS
jgi:cell division protein ZapA